MKKLFPGLAALIVSAGTAHASALLQKDDTRRELKVIARIVYSGAALTEANAAASTDEISRMWNETMTEITLKNKRISFNSKSYKVVFEVDYVMPGAILKNKESCAYNFIQILDLTSPGDRSYYEGLGSRNGVFYTSDELGTSTTAAHEFGHGLMLDHNPGDQRAAEVPGIMFARGTLVRAEYQWDPSAQSGQAGGTIRPHTRLVRSEDIKAIPFARVAFNNKGFGCLGNGSVLPIQ